MGLISELQPASKMVLFKFRSAIITRVLFMALALIAVVRVISVKNNVNYWLLTLLFVPLVVETIITVKWRKGEGYKWFSPPILLFLISIIPSIWILELHHQQSKEDELKCYKLDSWENMRRVIAPKKKPENSTKIFSTVCANDWILAIHQILLILLIVGKWLLPLGGGITRNELSRLLLIFVGTAADILEFNSETLSDVKEEHPKFVCIILSVWTWSMLQFPLHVSVVNSEPGVEEGQEDQGVQEVSLLTKHGPDIWSIAITLLIQDGPFLIVRLIVMLRFKVVHQVLCFFAIKNVLVIALSVYRLVVIYQEFRPSRHKTAEPVPSHESHDLTAEPVPSQESQESHELTPRVEENLGDEEV